MALNKTLISNRIIQILLVSFTAIQKQLILTIKLLNNLIIELYFY